MTKPEIGRREAEFLLILGVALIVLGFALKRLLSARSKTEDKNKLNSFVNKQPDVKTNS